MNRRLRTWAVACALLGVLALAGTRAARAQETLFSPLPAWSGPTELTRAVALGDVDRDGDLDLVRGNYDQEATLYLNVGGTFAAAAVWRGPAERTNSVALGDVDGDGDLDLIRGNFNEVATLYLNVGGTFSTSPVPVGRVENTFAVALGDVDGDGDLDLIRGNGNQAVTLYLNTDGRFAETPVSIAVQPSTTSLALGDVDGDGDPEVVCGNNSLQAATLFVNHDGVFADTPIDIGSVQSTRAVALGDLDGDGDLDLVRGNAVGGSTVYLNAAGSWDNVWTSQDDQTTSVALGDVDGDGDLDIVFGNYPRTATLHLNGGSGRDFATSAIGQEEPTFCVALGDVDGDGDLDLIRGNYDASGGHPNSASTLTLNVGGPFGLAPAWSGPSEFTKAVALGDVDRDGDLDVVRGNNQGGSTLYLNRAGTLDVVPAWTGPPEITEAIGLGDVNGDSLLDLVCGNFGAPSTIHFNTGDRFEDSPGWIGRSEDILCVALGDVNGDGRLDVVQGGPGNAFAYLNVGHTFETEPSWIGPVESTEDLTLGDVDGDDRLDLVRGNVYQRATLYRGAGSSFESVASWRGPVEGTAAVTLGDVDGDGDADLVRGNTNRVGLPFNTGATLYRNRGDATFESSPAWIGPAVNTESVALTDVDGDGDRDLVRGNRAQNAMVHLNIGGTFASTPAWTGPPEISMGVAVGDVDGDGAADLVRGNFGQPATLYRRRSPWRLGSGAAGRLPNNAAHLRWVRVALAELNHYRISFQAVDLESDPVEILGEYQFEGAPSWFPMELGDGPRSALLTTSPGGDEHALTWDVSRLALDRRSVVVRLRAISTPRHEGIVQFIPAYFVDAGRIRPVRPDLAVAPAVLDFGIATVGDTVHATIELSNRGSESLVLSRFESLDPDVVVPADSLVVPAGASRSVGIALAALRLEGGYGPVRIHSNDPTNTVREISIEIDVRPIAFTTQLVADGTEVPLGEPLAVVVTPERAPSLEGHVFHRCRPDSNTAGTPFDSTLLVMLPPGTSLMGVIPGDAVTEGVLEYYVRVRNHTESATDPPGAPESVHRRTVSDATAIQTSARPDADGDFPAGRGTQLVVSLPRGSTFRSGLAHYRRGGAAVFERLELELVEVIPGVFSPAVTIPGDAMGPRGLEYWVEVNTALATLTDPPRDPALRPRTIRAAVTGLSDSVMYAGGRYRMMSVPLELGLPTNGSLEAVLSDQPEFGPYDPTRWRAFRYDPSVQRNQEISSVDAAARGMLRPEPGRAFWLVSRDAHRIDTAPVSGRSTPTGAPYPIVIEPGWNQIANPFAFRVAWSSVSAPDSLDGPIAYDAAAGQYRDANAATLEPFDGYFVFNGGCCTDTLWVEPVEAPVAPAIAATTSPLESATSESWTARLRARTESASDASNLLGVRAGATDALDAFDRAEPPAVPGHWVRVAFAAGDRSSGRLLSHDFRPAGAGNVWEIELTSETPGEPVILELVSTEPVPEGVRFRLIDREQGSEIDLDPAGGRSRVLSFGAERSYRLALLAGTAEWVERTARAALDVPVRLALDQNSPNPIRTATRMRYGIPHAGPVTLEVFDVTGKRVARLINGAWRAPGYHALVWDGVGPGGRPLPSGVYFSRLTATGTSIVRRMVLAR